jgi:hypothetical protein
MIKKHKYYVYLDETGKDINSSIFLVSVLILGEERDNVGEKLKEIEENSGKRCLKWNGTCFEYRKNYIETIMKLEEIKGRLFFKKFYKPSNYVEDSSIAVSKAIFNSLSGENYKVTIFVDGFTKKEVELFTKFIRRSRIKFKKIRNIKKGRNDEFIRLVDSICGLVRDAFENNAYAKDILNRCESGKLIGEL